MFLDGHKLLQDWINRLIGRTPSRQDTTLISVVQDFIDFIDNNAVVRMYATTMFDQIPLTPPYNNDPEG